MLTELEALHLQAVRLAIYVVDLQAWYNLPWYQRLVTPKPVMPEGSPRGR